MMGMSPTAVGDSIVDCARRAQKTFNHMDYFAEHWLDITTTFLGILYIILEYKATIWLWAVGLIMQVLDVFLYYQSKFYADFAMEFYYIFMSLYGIWAWKFGKKHGQKEKEELPITHFKANLILPWTIASFIIWAAIWYALTKTDSTVPVGDAFTTAFSFVGAWALARKYLEQWLIWIAVDVVASGLYFYKGLPFKGSLYALYVVIAIMGYFRWRKQMQKGQLSY